MSEQIFLHRFRFEFSNQQELFSERRLTPASLLEESIRTSPAAEIRKGSIWRIGEVEDVGHAALKAQIGRQTRPIVGKFDIKMKAFVETFEDQAPFTILWIDLKYQLIGITHKPSLSPDVKGIARNFSKLINQSQPVVRERAKLIIDPIVDPQNFIQLILKAARVSRFSMTFRRPNPWDVEKDFQKPMEDFVKNSEGTKGKAQVEGESLNKPTLVKLAGAGAATGDEVKAKIHETKESRGVTKTLTGSTISIEVDPIIAEKEPASVIKELQNKYEAAKGSDV